MAEQFAAPPINPLISIQPLTTPAPNRDTTGVPAQLANLPPGTTIEGFVINRDAQANPILRTPLGDLLIKSDVFLKTGSEVVFKIDPSLTTRARILTVDGVPLQDYAAQNTRGITQDTIMQMGSGKLPGNPQTAQVLPALLLSHTPPTPAMLSANPQLAAFQQAIAKLPLPPALTNLKAGATLMVIAQRVNTTAQTLPLSLPGQLPQQATPSLPSPAAMPLPATQQRPEGVAPQVSPPPPSLRAAASTPPSSHQAPPAMSNTTTPTNPVATPSSFAPPHLPPSVRAPYAPSPTPAATVAAANQPTTGPAPSPHSLASVPFTPPAAGTANSIPALVIGQEANGSTVLHTPLGTLKIMLPQPVPAGTQMTLELRPQAPATTPSSTAPMVGELEQPVSILARDWQAMDEAMRWAAVNDPALARSLAQALPQAEQKLGSGLLFFLAAVKGGDMKQWLGRNLMNQLESKVPGVATRLKQDMTQLQQLFTDPPVNQWSSVMLPMLVNEQLEHARLFVHRDPKSDAKSGQQGGHRFIVEVDLSHVGELQFDGFVRQAERGKHFDLFVRSAAALPVEISQGIRQIFDEAVQAAGHKGYIAFQHGREHFARPLATKTDAPNPPDPHTILA